MGKSALSDRLSKIDEGSKEGTELNDKDEEKSEKMVPSSFEMESESVSKFSHDGADLVSIKEDLSHLVNEMSMLSEKLLNHPSLVADVLDFPNVDEVLDESGDHEKNQVDGGGVSFMEFTDQVMGMGEDEISDDEDEIEDEDQEGRLSEGGEHADAEFLDD